MNGAAAQTPSLVALALAGGYSDQAHVAGVLNFSDGVFEPEMKGISDWFLENPPGDAF